MGDLSIWFPVPRYYDNIVVAPLPQKGSHPITLHKSGRMTYVNRIILVGNCDRPNGHGAAAESRRLPRVCPRREVQIFIRDPLLLALSCRTWYANNNNDYITNVVIVIRPYCVVRIVKPFFFFLYPCRYHVNRGNHTITKSQRQWQIRPTTKTNGF